MKFNRVTVIGLGYIGLPTAAVIASNGVDVTGVDVNPLVVETINKGQIHIVEPELDVAVQRVVASGKLNASLSPCISDVFIIAVPTPFTGENHAPDLSYIKSACLAIAPVLKAGNLVILESTSPVGATETMEEWLSQARSDLTFPSVCGAESDIRIAHCPERVLPGHVMREIVENDRIIGGITPKCSEFAVELYKTFVSGDCVVTNARTAEMAKLTENSYRDVNIAFANELSIICDKLDINVWELISLANRHPRVGILQPGPGVGGHCIAVDPWFIVSKTPDLARLIRTAREVNDYKPQWVMEQVKVKIVDFLQQNKSNKIEDITLACYGLSFKPDIDDLRESPALKIALKLREELSLRTIFVEPNLDSEKSASLDAELVDIETAITTADIHLLLVDHTEFKNVKPQSGLVIDTKGIWN